MRTVEDVAAFISSQPHILPMLTAVEALGLPDCWIGAGHIRNAVWDHLHGLTPAAVNDVDVVYFEDADVSVARDMALEARLAALRPEVPWSVHNQARMHTRNGVSPYRDTEDAIGRWPETATAIAARSIHGTIELLAPHGIDDLIGLLVRPTPAFVGKLPEYRARIASKDWAKRWPRLQFVETCRAGEPTGVTLDRA